MIWCIVDGEHETDVDLGVFVWGDYCGQMGLKLGEKREIFCVGGDWLEQSVVGLDCLFHDGDERCIY